jgi:hypothetical protein
VVLRCHVLSPPGVGAASATTTHFDNYCFYLKIKENMAAIALLPKLTEDVMARIEAATANAVASA